MSLQKLSEVYSSVDNINCISIGRKSGLVYSTGGIDNIVNVWRVGKINQALHKLDGHNSCIDSVSFDSGELIISAGSRGGNIKTWDLTTGKLTRTFTNHKSAVKSIDFHPFGDFFASGSADYTVKIWDIRAKGCMQTYRGHNSIINTIRHTPDGKWILSGDSNGMVKCWDITAGKLLQDIYNTNNSYSKQNSINSFDLHPQLFIVSISSENGVEWWDLETFTLNSSTYNYYSTNNINDPIPSKCSLFTLNDGNICISGNDYGIELWNWDTQANPNTSVKPLNIIKPANINNSFYGLTDMAIVPDANRLVTASKNKNIVCIHTLDLDQAINNINQHTVDHTNNTPINSSNNPNNDSSVKNSLRAARQAKRIAEAEADAKARQKLNFNNNHNNNINSNDNNNIAQPKVTRDYNDIGHNNNNIVNSNIKSNPNAAFFKAHQQGEPIVITNNNNNPTNILPPKRYPINTNNNTNTDDIDNEIINDRNINKHMNIDNGSTLLLGDTTNNFDIYNSDSIRHECNENHDMMRKSLSDRLSDIKILAELWNNNNNKSLFNALNRLSKSKKHFTLQVVVDFLNSAELQLQKTITLEYAAIILQICSSTLLDSPFESYVQTALRYIKFILNSFSNIIIDTRNNSFNNNDNISGLDLAREQRIQRVNDCYEEFRRIHNKIQSKLQKQTPIGEQFRQVNKLLQKLLEA